MHSLRSALHASPFGKLTALSSVDGRTTIDVNGRSVGSTIAAEAVMNAG